MSLNIIHGLSTKIHWPISCVEMLMHIFLDPGKAVNAWFQLCWQKAGPISEIRTIDPCVKIGGVGPAKFILSPSFKSHFKCSVFLLCSWLLSKFRQYWSDCDQILGAVAFCQDWVKTGGEGFMPMIIWYSLTANILPDASFYKNHRTNSWRSRKKSCLPSNVKVVIKIGCKFCSTAFVSPDWSSLSQCTIGDLAATCFFFTQLTLYGQKQTKNTTTKNKQTIKQKIGANIHRTPVKATSNM